jgi:tetratricopeptide (TPR) repeat protein
MSEDSKKHPLPPISGPERNADTRNIKTGSSSPPLSPISGAERNAELAKESSLPELEGYEITGPLGRGGMGTVWRAVQLAASREVALKFLGRGAFGSEKARARFEREVELTGRLQHPNIARLYESGVDKGGYYYAMELIEGVPLDDYVKEHALNQRQILKLMQTVCQAVQHAHERGVMHRDLKPSNILVTQDGQPHVLDFGLAKGFLDGDSDMALSTDGHAAGTPAYMSPEQAAGHADQIDIRADVYSLGVILFRLLVGQPPLDVSGTWYEILRRIAQDDVRRPRDLTRKVDGELEAILLKALAHDPKDRYSSAGILAQDIENYLTGEPLLAKQRSTLYFLRKRLWKYRLPVAIACSVLALLIGLAVFAYIRIAGERNKAVAAHDKAQDEADKANTVYEFLGDILSSVEPEKAHGREVTLREAVDQAAKDVSVKFANQPEVEARIRTRIGDIYSALGQYREAEGQYFCALEIRRDKLGREHPDTLASMYDLAKSLGQAGKLRESETMHREVLEIRRRVLGDEHVDTLKSLGALGSALLSTGKLDESERVLRQAVKLDERVLGEEHKVTLEAMAGLASTLTERGKLDAAEAMARRVLGIRRRVLGEEHPDTMDSVRILARVLVFRGEGDEAGPMYERDLEFQRERKGDEHPNTLGAMTNWTWVLWDRGKLEEAEATAREVFEARRRLLGDEHPDTLTAMFNLARAVKRTGGLREAETILKRCIEVQQRVLGRGTPKHASVNVLPGTCPLRRG